MAREKRVRKPKDFMVRGRLCAWCFDMGIRQVGLSNRHMNARDLRRLIAWLARAQAWVEDGKKGGW